MPKLFFFNTTIMPNKGMFSNDDITADAAKSLIQNWDGEKISAIGHEATAQAMTTLLETDIPVNRIFAQMQPGDAAICLKIRGRLPEGQILTLKELDEIGYDLLLMKQHEKTSAE